MATRRTGIYINLWNRGDLGISFGPFKSVYMDDGMLTGYKFEGQITEEKIAACQRPRQGDPLKWRTCQDGLIYDYMTIKMATEWL